MYAPSYEKSVHAITGPHAVALADIVAAELERAGTAAAPAPTVLDVACGAGISSQAFLGACPGATIDATDFAPNMVGIAKERLGARVRRTFVADASALPTELAGSYDVVFSNFGIVLVPDVPKALAEAFRVIRPGGLVAFTTWDMRTLVAPGNDPWGFDLIAELKKAATGGSAGTTSAGAPATVKPAGIALVDDASAWARAAGFVDVVVRPLSCTSVIRDATALIHSYLDNPALSDMFGLHVPPGAARDTFVADIARKMEDRVGHRAPFTTARASFAITARKAL